MKDHHYRAEVTWTGNLGSGTSGYTAYSRDHQINIRGKSSPIEVSSDPSFRGDSSRYNPEELFLSSLASCHLLWYLHLCSANGITVMSYSDHPEGTMTEKNDGSGAFSVVTLYPRVAIAEEEKIPLALSLHAEASKKCFIANSCNFPIHHHPEVVVG